jgi:hypothetical protein
VYISPNANDINTPPHDISNAHAVVRIYRNGRLGWHEWSTYAQYYLAQEPHLPFIPVRSARTPAGLNRDILYRTLRPNDRYAKTESFYTIDGELADELASHIHYLSDWYDKGSRRAEPIHRNDSAIKTLANDVLFRAHHTRFHTSMNEGVALEDLPLLWSNCQRCILEAWGLYEMLEPSTVDYRRETRQVVGAWVTNYDDLRSLYEQAVPAYLAIKPEELPKNMAVARVVSVVRGRAPDEDILAGGMRGVPIANEGNLIEAVRVKLASKYLRTDDGVLLGSVNLVGQSHVEARMDTHESGWATVQAATMARTASGSSSGGADRSEKCMSYEIVVT